MLRFHRTVGSALTLIAGLLLAQQAGAAFPASVPLSTLSGAAGTRADGLVGTDSATVGDALGSAVVAVGDFNGDGVSDIAFGAPAGGGRPGSVQIVYGRSGGLPFPIGLGSPGTLRLDGVAPDDLFGAALAAGDVNGDGIADLIIGAPALGAVFVVYGQPAALGAPSLVSAVPLQGPAASQVGYSVSVGDVNGDGIADIVIGTGAGAAGAYVVFGRAGGVPALDLNTLTAPNGFRVGGLFSSGGRTAVAAVGDVTGDGVGDLVVGLPDNATAYLVPGSRTAGTSVVDLSSPGSATLLVGPAGSWFGFSVAGVGDLNGDGRADLAIGAPLASASSTNDQAGRTYVVYGSAAFPTVLDASLLSGANGGFQVVGAATGDRSGWSVAAGGDVNADGRPDLLIGAPYSSYTARAAGAAYAIFGQATSGTNVNLNGSLPNSLNGSNGFQMVGAAAGDLAGYAVSSGGDVNRDGGGDVVIGAANQQFSRGAAYVLYGQAPTPADPTPPVITGSRSPAPNRYGWNNTAVTVSFACSDAGSGIRSCTPATTLAGDGANQSVVGTAVDNAGNTASATVGGISIDRTPPAVSVSGVTAGAFYFKSPSVKCVSSDALSGLVSTATLTITRGGTYNGFTAYTATCSGARDRAGNTGSASVSFFVKKR